MAEAYDSTQRFHDGAFGRIKAAIDNRGIQNFPMFMAATSTLSSLWEMRAQRNEAALVQVAYQLSHIGGGMLESQETDLPRLAELARIMSALDSMLRRAEA
jgi:hypothetical protein